MTDNIIKEVLQFAEESAKRTDKINERLVTACKYMAICIVVISICFAITVCYKDYAYFFSDYAYPSVEQEVTDEKTSQIIK